MQTSRSKLTLDMPQAHQDIWVKIRAELTVRWNEVNNLGKFINGFSMNKATELARLELDACLAFAELEITLEDMLLNSLDDCLIILENAKRVKIFKAIHIHKTKK